MINRILALVLGGYYLLITIGIPISIHHCHGHNSFDISWETAAECSCHITDSEPACCQHNESESVQMVCNTDKTMAPECCSNETETILWLYEGQWVASPPEFIKAAEISLLYSVVQPVELTSKSEQILPDYYLIIPPLLASRQVSQHQFVFYG